MNEVGANGSVVNTLTTVPLYGGAFVWVASGKGDVGGVVGGRGGVAGGAGARSSG